ncbi:hypothetical protein SGPA1_31210 [Streptomyces misionensis JCM 4497]
MSEGSLTGEEGCGLGWPPYKHSREPGRTGLRGRLAASDRTNLIRVMPAKGGAGRPCRHVRPTHPTSLSSEAGSSAWSRPGGPRSAGSPPPWWTPRPGAGPPRSRPGCWPRSPNCTTARRPCSP